MARKWNNIKEKKAQKDKNTSRIYAKFGKEIYVAAKSGEPDPTSNQALRLTLERAKTYSVPNHIIDRAIEKAKGGGEENYDELRYEGFGPRSEEHTSELQSRFDLVCRLLLEKKKTRT